MLTGSLSRGREYQGLSGGRRNGKKTMTLISVYTREQAIEDGVLIRFEDYVWAAGGVFGPQGIRDDIEMVRGNEDAKFKLGELVITPGAANVLHVVDALNCLLRHQFGDWGEVCAEDRETNERALKDGSRLVSVYEVEGKNGKGVRFYIITEWNREATTILLPEDY